MDSDDLSKSFLVSRFIGRGSRADQEEEEEGLAGQEDGTIQPRSGRSWGARGISVSADDTLAEHDRRTTPQNGAYADDTAAGDAQIIDPAHFEDDDDDADAPPPPVAKDDKYKPFEAPEDQRGPGMDISTTAWAQNTGDH